VAAGLVRAVADADADVLVLGSTTAAVAGSWVSGSVATRLLHSSEVPLLLAPHGYRDTGMPFTSITCAYAGEQSREALAASCDLAERFHASLWVTTFVPRAPTMYPPLTGLSAEDLVSDQWAQQAVRLHADAVAFCHERGVNEVRSFIARGDGWEDTLRGVDWDAHDLLIFGSSRVAPLARVFLGSTATKILRYTPVPALVLPAGTYHWRA
jgi:nucleotide-binding universal stress UspA family protein